jgi:hypothetical protein
VAITVQATGAATGSQVVLRVNGLRPEALAGLLPEFAPLAGLQTTVSAALTLPPPAAPLLAAIEAEGFARASGAEMLALLGPAGVPAELSPFFPDVAGRLAGAHLVVARAGAGTVAELACAGRPSILVPLPHAIDDHQQANARALAEAGAAKVMPQATLTSATLALELAALLGDPRGLARAAASAAKLAQPDAARRLADLVLSLIRAKARQDSP